MLLYERSSRLTFNKLIAFVNPSDPNSDQHVISPYNNTSETFTKIVRIKEMITNLWLLEEFSLSALKGMYWENYGEYE